MVNRIITAAVIGLTGVLVGGVAGLTLGGSSPDTPGYQENHELTRLGAQMDKAEMLLRDIRAEVAAKREWLHQDKSDYSEVRAMDQAESRVASAIPCEQARDVGMVDPLVEDAVVQTIITRLYDPRYAEALSLADIMQSDDMLGLSDSSRERVVSEIVGMMNRGEINPMSVIRTP